MPNLVNTHAEIGADIIGDDAQPTLTLRNTGTGPGLRVLGLSLQSTTSIDQINLGGSAIPAANATIGLPFHIAGTSRPSGALIALKVDAFVSAVSLIFAAGANWAGMGAIRVVRTDGTFGWIPILPDGQVTAAAVP